MTESTCPGCGLALAATGGPTHEYVVTSPECWALFSRTIHQVNHRLLTDAYMAQHPDGDDRRQRQSVAVHLVTLRATLIDGQPLDAASRITSAAVDLGRTTRPFPKLVRPDTWEWTIQDVHEESVDAGDYAESVLAAWEPTEGRRIEEWTRATLADLYAG